MLKSIIHAGFKAVRPFTLNFPLHTIGSNAAGISELVKPIGENAFRGTAPVLTSTLE